MTPAELREAVARAIWVTREDGFPGRVRLRWEDATDLARHATMADADAALRVVREAMRESSTHMDVAGALVLREQPGNAAGAYEAMLAASPLREE